MLRHEELEQLAKEIETNAQAIAIFIEKQRRLAFMLNDIASVLEEESQDGPENPSSS